MPTAKPVLRRELGVLKDRYFGVEMPRTDPVLRMTRWHDERAWDAMIGANQVIRYGLQRRQSSIIGAGFRLETGESRSPAADELRRWVLDWMQSVKNWNEVVRLTFDAVPYGWRPMNLIWGEMRSKGRTYFAPVRIKERPHHLFAFTAEGEGAEEHRLVYRLNGKYEEVDNSAPMRMWLPAWGSTESPYGKGLLRYVWTIDEIRRRFLGMWAAGMGASTGVLHAKRRGGSGAKLIGGEGGSSSGTKSLEKIAAELRQVRKVLARDNILISLEDYDLEWLENISYADGWSQPIEYCDRLISLVLTGDALGMTIGSREASGSRAALTTASANTDMLALGDAFSFSGWMQELITDILEWNFGEVDPDDVPTYEPRLLQKAKTEDLQALYEMGLPIDGRRVADDMNVPVAVDAPDEIELQKGPEPRPLALGEAEGEGGPEDQTEAEELQEGNTAGGQDRGQEDARRFVDPETDEAVEELAEDEIQRSRDAAQKVIREMMEQFRDAYRR